MEEYKDTDFEHKLQSVCETLKKKFTKTFWKYYKENCSDRTSSLSENEYPVEEPEFKTHKINSVILKTFPLQKLDVAKFDVNNFLFENGAKGKGLQCIAQIACKLLRKENDIGEGNFYSVKYVETKDDTYNEQTFSENDIEKIIHYLKV